MNTTVYYIRHGEIDNPGNIIYGRSVDVKLNETGKRQIRDIAQTLKRRGVKPDVIYSSTLSRAVDSSKEITSIFPNTPVFFEQSLQDVDHEGLKHLTLDWLKNVANEDVYNYHGSEVVNLTSLETAESVANRMIGVLTKVKSENKGKTVFIVSHGDPIAFLWERVRNPKRKLQSRLEIIKQGKYPEKSNALKLVFDEAGNVIEQELIRGE